MRQDIAQQWVAALRSGKYKQGKGRLCRQDDEGAWRHCCLGVLCDLAEAEDVVNSKLCEHTSLVPGEGDEIYLTFGRSSLSGTLPLEVIEWAEMNSSVGSFPAWSELQSCASMNDLGGRFETIADAIDLHYATI